MQETIGWAVVDDIFDALAPRSVACRLVLTHACMTARGEHARGSKVETIAHRGESQLFEVSP